jgi:hypothetical protein
MPTNFLFFESIRKQLLNQGYYSIVIVNKHEGPEQCFLSKKQFLPDILLETNFLMVPLTDSYAVDIIKKHFDDKFSIINGLPSIALLESSQKIIDNEYLFQITGERWLHIYKRGQSIDTIDMCQNRQGCYENLITFIEDEVITKDYFSLPFGYALMLFIQKSLPFEKFNLKEIFHNYEEEEARFEATCFDKSIGYLPNLNLTEKIEYIEGVSDAPFELSANAHLDHTYYNCNVNLCFKMVQLGFILTNPLGELYEPIKINLSL